MSYVIKELFPTLQGEGARAGTRAVFIRFAGCNLWNGRPEDRDKGSGACAQWCDTDFFKGEKLELSEIVERVERAFDGTRFSSRMRGEIRDHKWIVLTGGEPTLQADEEFAHAFRQRGWRIAIETNGTREAGDWFDWITLSPKKGTELVQLEADELKVVLPGSAIDPWLDEELLSLAAKTRARNLFVQPQDPIVPTLLEASHLRKRTLGARWEFEANAKRCVEFVMKHPEWRLSFQIHKLLDIR